MNYNIDFGRAKRIGFPEVIYGESKDLVAQKKLQMFKREIEEVETEYGKFRIKITTMPNGTKKVKPESSDLLKYCFENKINQINLSQKIVGTYENDK